MGYAICTGTCGCCKRMFSFNPKRVPSLNNVPFCRECVEMANVVRKEKGIPELKIHPQAYEPCEEGEL
jgi:hypothetical protein